MFSLYNLDKYPERLQLCQEKMKTDQLLENSAKSPVEEGNDSKEEDKHAEEAKPKQNPNEIDQLINF